MGHRPKVPRKICPTTFTAMYERGEKMLVIARWFGATRTSCKNMRRRLGLRPRPPHRPKVTP